MIVILMAQCLVLSVNHVVVSVYVYLVYEDVGVMNAALEPLTSLPLDAEVRKKINITVIFTYKMCHCKQSYVTVHILFSVPLLFQTAHAT